MARTNDEYRWTRSKQIAFLRALMLHGKVAKAARAVGMSRQSAYRMRARDAELSEYWFAAQAIWLENQDDSTRQPG